MLHYGYDGIAESATLARWDDDEWKFICVTYDGSSKAEGQKFYVDGKLVSSEVYEGHNNLTDHIQTDTPFMIGNRGCNDSHTSAALDEIRVVSGVLSEDWIQTQYLSMKDRLITYRAIQSY